MILTKSGVAVREPPREQKNTGRPGDWKCPKCSYLNISRWNECKQCGEPVNESARLFMNEGDWVCKDCGNMVYKNNWKCRMCNAPKPGTDGTGPPQYPAQSSGEKRSWSDSNQSGGSGGWQSNQNSWNSGGNSWNSNSSDSNSWSKDQNGQWKQDQPSQGSWNSDPNVANHGTVVPPPGGGVVVPPPPGMPPPMGGVAMPPPPAGTPALPAPGGTPPPAGTLQLIENPNAPKTDGGGDPFNGMTVRDLLQVMMKAKEGGPVDPSVAAMMGKMNPGGQQPPSGNMGDVPAGGCPGNMPAAGCSGSMGSTMGNGGCVPPPAPPPPMGGIDINSLGGMGCMGQPQGAVPPPGGCPGEPTVGQIMAAMMNPPPPPGGLPPPPGGCTALVPAQTAPAIQDPAMAAALEALQQTNANAAAMGVSPGIDPTLGAFNSASGLGGLAGVPALGSTDPAAVDAAGQAELINQLSTMAAAMMLPGVGGAAPAGTPDPAAALAGASPADLAALAASGMDANTMATLLTLYGLQAAGAAPEVKKRKFKGGPAEAKPGDWICSACETLNYCMEKTCYKCEADNTNAERVGMKLGDWICPNCSDLVFSQNRACRKCQTRRPAETLKGGEWICDKCDYIVFWFKKVCSKCNAPRPGEGVAVKVFDELKKERNRQDRGRDRGAIRDRDRD